MLHLAGDFAFRLNFSLAFNPRARASLKNRKMKTLSIVSATQNGGVSQF